MEHEGCRLDDKEMPCKKIDAGHDASKLPIANQPNIYNNPRWHFSHNPRSNCA